MNETSTFSTEIRSRWNELPEELKAVLLDPLFIKETEEIAREYSLSAQQQRILENEIILVLFLFEPISNLGKRLSENMGVTLMTADTIVFEVKAGILYGLSELFSAVESSPNFTGIRPNKPTAPASSTGPQTTKPSIPAAPVNEPPSTLPKIESSLRDKLELRPNVTAQSPAPEAPAQPLTRNDVLDYLTAKRTMAHDVAEAQKSNSGTVLPPPPREGA